MCSEGECRPDGQQQYEQRYWLVHPHSRASVLSNLQPVLQPYKWRSAKVRTVQQNPAYSNTRVRRLFAFQAVVTKGTMFVRCLLPGNATPLSPGLTILLVRTAIPAEQPACRAQIAVDPPDVMPTRRCASGAARLCARAALASTRASPSTAEWPPSLLRRFVSVENG
jgi:hypothetical protein